MIDIEFCKNLVELISSFAILIAAIIGANAFKYKHDSSIRDLYVENCKKIREVLGYVYSSGNINHEMYNQAKKTYHDACIYLHDDIIKFTENVLSLIIDLDCCKSELEGLEVGPERSNICKKSSEIQLKLHELNKQSMFVYRKHIIEKSLFVKISQWCQSEIGKSVIINKIVNLKFKILTLARHPELVSGSVNQSSENL